MSQKTSENPARNCLSLILFPLKAELEAFRVGLAELGAEQPQRFLQDGYPLLCYEKSRFCLALGGVGKAQFATQAQFWLQRFPEFKRLVTCGMAGGLQKEVFSPGTLALVESITEYDFLSSFQNGGCPEFQTEATWNQLVLDWREDERSASGVKDLIHIHTSRLASGDREVSSWNDAKEVSIKSQGGQIVAWESAGGARAAKFARRDYNELRVVVDTCSPESLKAFPDFLNKGMKDLSQIVLDISLTS